MKKTLRLLGIFKFRHRWMFSCFLSQPEQSLFSRKWHTLTVNSSASTDIAQSWEDGLFQNLKHCRDEVTHNRYSHSSSKLPVSHVTSKIGGKDVRIEITNAESFRDIVQRFKNLEKKRESDDTEAVFRESRMLVNIFIKMSTLPDLKVKIVENLNTILNFYGIFGRSDHFDDLAAKMKSMCIANEATYFLIIRHEMQSKTWRDGLKIVDHMQSNAIDLHARTYHYIILNAVKSGHLTDAIFLLNKMRAIENVFHDEFYGLLIDTAKEKGEITKLFVLKVFESLKDTGFMLGPKTFGSTKKWFESDKRKTWKVGTSLVNLRGICKCCGCQLEPFSLPVERQVRLQQKLQRIAETSICKAENKTSWSKLPAFNSLSGSDPKSKIHEFKHYMVNNGPFDVALDVLNVAYYRDRGFNSFQVKRVVRHFKSKGKHVLALCSSPLVSTLLDSEVAPDLPNYHMIQLLHYLRRQGCGIFFVDDRKEDGHIDDYFVILSMVHQNMDIDIITADKFGDHVHSLDSTTKQDFNRWMRSHQIVLRKFTDQGEPIFHRRENYDVNVQSTETSWHFPGPNRQWLCCTRK